MKSVFIAVWCLLSLGLAAQSTFTKTYPVAPGQPISLKFDYPVVRVSTWDKNEVSIAASVNINDHENDSAFLLSAETTNGKLVISDRIIDIDKLPRRYTVFSDGKKTIYKSEAAFREATKNGHVQSSSEGSDIHIVLEIKLPSQCTADINAVYGIVEMVDFHAPVTVDATYGGIDATIAAATTGKLKATTHYGQIYSNLDLKITDHSERDFYNSITAEPGTGPSFSLTSAYGKIYLRKP